MLVRTFIGKRLASYYAQPSHTVVGTLPTKTNHLHFPSLLGEYHWKYRFRQIYQRQEGQWMTPVELFQPYYSNILANYIATHSTTTTTKTLPLPNSHDHDHQCHNHRPKSPHQIQIVEFGGGRGTNVNCLLTHLKECHPHVYENVQYMVVENSPTLHQLQWELVKQGDHGDKVHLIQGDITDVAEGRYPFLEPSNVETYFLAMEVLDNLPHDKISRCPHTGDLLQAEVVSSLSSSSNEHVEHFVPLTDPLLQTILHTLPQYAPFPSQKNPQWIPTIACGLLMELLQLRPNSHILLADFDSLPPPDLPVKSISPSSYTVAEGEPLVTCMKDQDHESYLTAPLLSDILFPTNFPNLAAFVNKLVTVPKKDTKKETPQHPCGNRQRVKIWKQSEFLWEMGHEEVLQTESWISGYSPLIHDFGNCSVLTVCPETPTNSNKV